MKKILFFALLLCSLTVLNAQNQLSIVYNGNVYNPGDTLVTVVEPDASQFHGLIIRNNTSNDLTNLVFTKRLVENHGIDIWGLCTGMQCVQSDTSAKFTVPANDDYADFYMDVMIDDEHSWSLYEISIHNVEVVCDFVLRMQDFALGINEVVAQSSVSVYPNPSQGQVNVRYNVEQPSTLVVYDAQGRTISQQTICCNGTTAISNLPAGIYAYGIAGSQMHKLIVK